MDFNVKYMICSISDMRPLWKGPWIPPGWERLFWLVPTSLSVEQLQITPQPVLEHQWSHLRCHRQFSFKGMNRHLRLLSCLQSLGERIRMVSATSESTKLSNTASEAHCEHSVLPQCHWSHLAPTSQGEFLWVSCALSGVPTNQAGRKGTWNQGH